MEALVGYGILAGYLLLLLILGGRIGHRFPQNNLSIEEYLFAGKGISFGLLAPSIFTSWIWVTTIVGSGEAGFRFGISGGLSYSLGAGLAFAVFTAIIIKMKRLMPEGITVIDFVGVRFTPFLKDVYYIFAVLVVIYVVVEQSAGIALVFNGLFGISFKKIAFLTVLLCGVYVTWRGMRGVLYNELINFFMISAGILIFAFIILKTFDMERLHSGLSAVVYDSTNRNYNPQALNILSRSGMMYAFSAILIALGQLLVDPAYYMKAYIARNERTFMFAFFTGGFLYWMPIAIISSFVLGYVTLSQNMDFSQAINLSIEISTNTLINNFGIGTALFFALLVFCIGCTSIIHGLIGIQSLYTLDFYKNKINSTATEGEQLKFGKVVILLIALLCALISISLEKVSLLTIDMFSGIFFAAPCGVILVGMFSKKKLGNVAWISVALGIAAGFLVWVTIQDEELNYFLGIACSFFVPFLSLSFAALFSKERFNFKKLLFFRP